MYTHLPTIERCVASMTLVSPPHNVVGSARTSSRSDTTPSLLSCMQVEAARISCSMYLCVHSELTSHHITSSQHTLTLDLV